MHSVRELALTTLAVALVLFPLDFAWLKGTRELYEREMGALLLPQSRLGIAAAFYALYAFGIAFLAVTPNLGNNGTISSAAGYGAILGLVAYGAYDLTNYATLRDFPATIMAVDWAWGVVLTAASAAGAWVLRHWIF